uniref:AP2/ERF domain-containing protein n=1 Tax=Macrostomum lignano TaxID=282301 RepID=A0A1I8HC22_9PLAT
QQQQQQQLAGAALHRPESPARGQVYRGRVLRNAAGSRSAGGVRGGNNIPGYLRDKKPHTELLDDLCARNGLCTPSYQVQSHELLDTVTGAKSNWFLGRVTLANVGNSGPRQYSAFRFTQTTEEARVAAAESALLQLAQPAATVLPDPGQAFVAQNFNAVPLTAALPLAQSPVPQQQQQQQSPLRCLSSSSCRAAAAAATARLGASADPYQFPAAAAYQPPPTPIYPAASAAAMDPNSAAAFFAAAAAAAAANGHQQHPPASVHMLPFQHHQQQQHHQSAVAASGFVNPAALSAMLAAGSDIYTHYVN